MFYQSLKRGDTVEATSPQALFEDGSPRWHALFIRPQREAAAQAWLAFRDVYSFYPVTRHTVTIRGKRKTHERRYLPGYLFAEFAGPVVWHRVFATTLIADTIRMASGTPGILMPEDVEAIHAMRSRDEDRVATRRLASTIRPGDKAFIKTGALAGQVVEVATINAGKATFRSRMFDSERHVEIGAEDLEKVQMG